MTSTVKRVIFLIISGLLLGAVFLPISATASNANAIDCTDCHNNTARASSDLNYLIGGVQNPGTINVPAGGSFEINFLFDEMNDPIQTGYQIVCEPLIGLPLTGSGGTGTTGLPWPQPTRGTVADPGTSLTTSTGSWKTAYEASDSNGVASPPTLANQWIYKATNDTGTPGGPDMPTTHGAYTTDFAGSSWEGQNGSALDDGSEPDLATALMGTDVTIAVQAASAGTYLIYIAGVGHNAFRERANVMTTLTVNVTASAVPTAPTIGTPIAILPTTIQWRFTDNASYESGFSIHDSTHNVVASRDETNVSYIEETGLTPNTQYTRHAHAFNGAGDSPGSGDASLYTLANTPTVPVAAADSTSQIAVSWTASVGGASHYHVRSSSNGYATNVYDNVLTSFTESLLSPNTQYTYRIWSVNADGVESAAYAEISRYTMIQAPTGIIFGTITNQSIMVSARDVLSNMTAGLSGVFLANTTLSTDSGWINTNTWSSQPLAQNTLYSFKARARNGDGVVTAETGLFQKYSLPDAPATAAATASSTASIDVSWTAATGGADHYHVRSSSDGYGTIKYNGSGLSYTELSLSPNTRYTYRIYAINADGAPRPDYTAVSRYTLIANPTGVTFGTTTPFAIPVSGAGTLPNLSGGLSGVLLTNITTAANSGWIQTNSWVSQPLIPASTYSFKAQARNGDGVVTAETAPAAKGTLDEISGSPDVAIISPTVGQEVSGQLQLTGTASADSPPFASYVVQYGIGATPTSWVQYGGIHTTPVYSGVLETINTLRMNNETYTFRVVVTDTANSLSSASVPVLVRNPLRPAAPHGSYQLDSDMCALCHSSHTAIGNPGILRFGALQYQAQLCYSCHNGTGSIYNIASEFDANASHHPIKDVTYGADPLHTLDCSSCHDPHGTEEVAGWPMPRLLSSKDGLGVRSFTGNPFCYSCHGASGSIKDMRYFETNNGHNNTDADQTVAFTNPGSGTKIKCSQCHEPHGGAQTRLRITAGKALCEPCHPDSVYTTRIDNEIVVGVGYPDTAFGTPFYASARVFTQDTFSAIPVSLAGPRQYMAPDTVFSPRTRAICVADANNDGKNEILMTIADGTSSELVMGVQTTNGYSIQPLEIVLDGDDNGGYGGYGIAVGDINIADSDGNEIIVTSLGSPGEITVIKLDSSNVIIGTPYTVVTGGDDPRDAVIANLYGDGNPEVVVSNFGSDTLSLFEYNDFSGKLELVGAPEPSGGSYPYGLAAGDVNNDSQTEIIVANQGYAGQKIIDESPYINDNIVCFDGSSGNLVSYLTIDNGSATAGWDVAVGNVMSGYIGYEIIVAGHPLWPDGLTENGEVTVFNANEAPMITKTYDPLDVDTKGVAVADANGDGSADVVVINANTISVFPFGASDLGTVSTYRTSGMNTVGLADEPGPLAIGNVGKLQPFGHRAEVYGECALCHDPHSVTKLAPIYGATGLEPLTYGTPTVYGAVSHVTEDYQLCYKCHSGGAVPMIGTRDTAEEFDPANASYHPVMDIGQRDDIPEWSFVESWGVTSTMSCGTCHGNDALAPNQIKHGSANAFNLIRPYAGQAPSDAGLLCYTCHNIEFYGPGTSTSGSYAWSRTDSSNSHRVHSKSGIDCATCHDVHGSPGKSGIIKPTMHMTGAVPGPFTCTTGCH